jgi:phenylpyruvate tautomerase PptA (4-oxalocrotonate tautomerase family)
MPFLKLTTNVTVSEQQSSELLTDFSKLLATETGKSENYVMAELTGGRDMIFAGNSDPLAFIECKSIGLSSTQAKSLSTSISQLLETKLQISPQRVYIEFQNCPADFWGWNGTTFG